MNWVKNYLKDPEEYKNNLAKPFFRKKWQKYGLMVCVFCFPEQVLQYTGKVRLLCIAKWLSLINSTRPMPKYWSISNEKDWLLAEICLNYAQLM